MCNDADPEKEANVRPILVKDEAFVAMIKGQLTTDTKNEEEAQTNV
jgi:hypothetical protein